MFMKGASPVRRTFQYLKSSKLILRGNVRILTLGVHYKNHHPKTVGAKDFAFWYWVQLQYHNPRVQLLKLKNLSPNPFLQAFFDDGSDMVIDLYGMPKEEIRDHVMKVLGKSELERKADALEQQQSNNPAYFGLQYARQCMCEVQGQQPCPGNILAPDYMRAHWRWKPDSDEDP